MQRRPHTVLLDANFYRNEMLPIFADWMMLYFNAQQVGTAYGDEHRKRVRAYLGSRGDKAASEGLKLTGVEWQILNLTHDWLHIFLPFSMKKVLRVTFGLMTQREVDACLSNDPLTTKSRLKLAIPFVGKDVPSPASEFAQPDIMIGLTILAYRLQGLRPDDLREVTKEMQKSLAKESGQPQHRPSAVLYADWVTEAGGEICGMPAPAAARSDETLQLGTCVLHLDSRSVASSDGTPSNSVWRDLSGHWLDIDVCADHGEVHVGHKCAKTAQTPIVGPRYVALEKEVNEETGERRELEPYDAGYETLCRAAYEALPAAARADFRQALRGRVLMSRVGGFYRCFPGTPLRLPKALTEKASGEQTLMQRGINTASGPVKDKPTTFDNRKFTLSVVVQAMAEDDKKKTDEKKQAAGAGAAAGADGGGGGGGGGAGADDSKARATRDMGAGHGISRLPISFGEGALQIGGGASVESLRFYAPSPADGAAPDAEPEVDDTIPYQVGARGSTEEPQLHQFVFGGTAEKRTVKYFVNGAPLGELPLKGAKLFSPGSPITVGQCEVPSADSGGGSKEATTTWHFDGFVFLVMVHATAMSDDTLLDMHKNLMLAPEEFGAPRTPLALGLHPSPSRSAHCSTAYNLLLTRFRAPLCRNRPRRPNLARRAAHAGDADARGAELDARHRLSPRHPPRHVRHRRGRRRRQGGRRPRPRPLPRRRSCREEAGHAAAGAAEVGPRVVQAQHRGHGRRGGARGQEGDRGRTEGRRAAQADLRAVQEECCVWAAVRPLQRRRRIGRGGRS